MIVPNPTAVGQQCSASRVPLLDASLLKVPRRGGRKTKARKGVKYEHPPVDDKDLSLASNDVQDAEVVTPRVLQSTSLGRSEAPRLEEVFREQARSPVTLINNRGDPRGDEEEGFEGSGGEIGAGDEGQYGECLHRHTVTTSMRVYS